MAGIYVHIPFCKSRCDYCDFYSTTLGTEVAERYIVWACCEITERKTYLGEAHIGSIYFGGGTPTRLSIEQLTRLCACIQENFSILPNAEITIEVNPDDITENFARALHALSFNRISMGVQSFNDVLLADIHRRHTSRQAEEAYFCLRDAGFENISLDLIYGLPDETLEQWESDVIKLITLRPEHVSAYALTYESGTPLYQRRCAGYIKESSEELYIAMYELLIDKLHAAGYEHYEISNFALKGFRSVHNSSYWCGIPYLGIGAGAHSYNGIDRRCNIPDVAKYITAKEDVPHETETLDARMRYNETVMTSLRTSHGIDLAAMQCEFGQDMFDYLLHNAENALRQELLEIRTYHNRQKLRLTRKGIFVSNDIISNLFFV